MKYSNEAWEVIGESWEIDVDLETIEIDLETDPPETNVA